jgi:hypothetical protein
MRIQKWELDSKFFRVIVLVLSAHCFLGAAHAQGDEPPQDAAPPPLRIISKNERSMLDGEKNIKKRTQLSLNLMEMRLKNAEELVGQSKFQDTINELGSFQALLETTLNHLEKNDDGGSKADFNFKRLEIGLRKTINRLELVRRELPFKYGYYVEKLQRFVREARAKAIEPLFGTTVLPEENNQP